ncbi:MAG: lysophospholipid acyltransferase family protein, partial [Pseudomonadota bacterium]
MIANMRLALMLGIMLPLTVALMPIQYAAIRFGWRLSKNLPRWWHRLLAKMIGLKISVNGELAADRPLMLVCNHVSWSDIIVLGSVAEVCFIAKKEVAKTPFAGLLAMLQRSIFVVREEKRRSADQAREVAERLRSGDVI